MVKVCLRDVAREVREVCKEDIANYPKVGLEHLDSGCIVLSKWDSEKETTFTKKFYKGQILFGRRRAYLKKAVVAPFDGVCSGDITVFEAIPERIYPDYLPFIIQNDSFFDYAVGKSTGSLSRRAKWEFLKKYEFDLPSLEEQKRLAEILWAAENEIEMLYHSIERAHQLLSSFIKHEKGTPIHLDKLVKICYGKSQKDVSSEKGQYPIYGTGGVLGYTNASLYNNESIIVGRKGTIDKPTYVPDSFWAVDTTYYLKPLSDFSMKWLYVYLRYGVNLYDLNEATGVPSINAERLAKLVIILLPKEKQMEVESLLLNIEEVIDRLYKQIEITNELKRQILSCKMC